jgi:hypothetical protein
MMSFLSPVRNSPFGRTTPRCSLVNAIDRQEKLFPATFVPQIDAMRSLVPGFPVIASRRAFPGVEPFNP